MNRVLVAFGFVVVGCLAAAGQQNVASSQAFPARPHPGVAGVNPMDYGAACNGTTADSAQLQAAIAANPRSAVVIPSGCAGINLGSTGLVITDGQVFDAQNVPIRYSGSGIAITNSAGAVANGVVIRNVRLDMTGSTPGAQGIILTDCEYCKIENFRVKGGPSGYVSVGLVTASACCTISSKIERGRVDGMVLLKGFDGGHQVTDSTVDTVYCGQRSGDYCYETDNVLNPVFVDAVAEGAGSAAFHIQNTWGALLVVGSDVEGGGVNKNWKSVFDFGPGNKLAVEASVSLDGWSGSYNNIVSGIAPLQGRIVTDSSQAGTLVFGNTSTPLNVTNTIPYGASSAQAVTIGATNSSAVNPGSPFQYQFAVTGSGAGQTLSLNQTSRAPSGNAATSTTVMTVNKDGTVSFPNGIAKTSGYAPEATLENGSYYPAGKMLANCGRMTTTASGSTSLSCPWVTPSSNCAITPVNGAAAPWSSYTPSQGSVTVFHLPAPGATYAIACSAN